MVPVLEHFVLWYRVLCDDLFKMLVKRQAFQLEDVYCRRTDFLLFTGSPQKTAVAFFSFFFADGRFARASSE